MNQQPKALRLADLIPHLQAMGDELRRLDAENEALRKDAERWRFAMGDGEYGLCKLVRVGRDFEWVHVTLDDFDAAMKGQS